jgi:3-hydroxyacyl-[acyl-carrier-protein] dehydratase
VTFTIAALGDGAGDRRCAEGRLRRPVRGDLALDGTARRHRQVLRTSRSKRPASTAFRMTIGVGSTEPENTVLMDKAAIEAVLPHRDPMLLIDEVLELVPGERVLARKTVTEEDCAGHFPGNPIMPGVKMVEALAQCGAVAVLSLEENRGKLALFAGIDDVRFKRIVRPGEVLTLECNVETVRGPVGRGKVKATVDGKLAVRGTLTFAVGVEESSDDE